MNVLVFQSFEELPPQFRAALSYPQQPNFFISLDWFALLFKTSLQPIFRPRIYILCSADGAPIAALFCCTRCTGADRTLLSMTNFYAIEYSASFVRADSNRVELARHLLQHIGNERPRWRSIKFSLLKNQDPFSAQLDGRLSAAYFSPHRFFQYENWFLATGGEAFEAYYARRPSQVRNTIARRNKKLDKGHTSVISVFRDPGPALDEATLQFTSVYNSSWKKPEPFPDFIPALIATSAALGVLRLGLLTVDGLPAAAQLWLTSGSRSVIYKLAYDERYAELGVGSILSKELFRVAMDDDRVAEIDYGVGSEGYKKDWMTECRITDGVYANNWRTWGGCALALTNASTQRLRSIRRLAQRIASAAQH